MIIPINLPAHSTRPDVKFSPQLAKLGTEEIILIELQGSFHVEGDQSGQLAAQLKIENEAKPTLLVGRNLLEGKIVNLSKPVAVLRKRSSDCDTMEIDGGWRTGSQEEEKGMIEYDMLAVVERKVLFSKRPMPMVNISSISTDVSVKK